MTESQVRLELPQKYDKITDAMSQGEQETIHGWLLAEGVEDLGPFEAFKHLEFVKRGGGGDNESWDVYVRKVPSRAHEIPASENMRAFERWTMSAAGALRAARRTGVAVPVLESQSSQKLGEVRGKVVKAEVDWGVFPDIEDEVTPYRVIMETEIKNLNLKEMVTRLYDYMVTWTHVAVCVGAKLYEWRDDGTFVSLGVVLRRDLSTGIPVFERIFNLGTRNADRHHRSMIADLYSWAHEKVDDGVMNCGPRVTMINNDTPENTVEQLPFEDDPLPEPKRLPTAIPERAGGYFTVPVSAAELFYKCGLTDTELAEVPDFNINLYESRLHWNLLDTDWNKRKRRRRA